MKAFRTFLPYFAVVLLIGAYIYFFERKPVLTETQKKGKVLVGFISDDINGILLEAPGSTLTAEKTPLVLEKDKEGVWNITAPKKYKADESLVRSALTVAGDLVPEKTLTEVDLAPYKLDHPARIVTFSDKNGKRTRMQVGSKDLLGNSYYVLVEGAKEVHLVQAASLENILKRLDDYRDHSFFKSDPILAKKVRVTHGEKGMTLEKDAEGKWRLTSPLKAKAAENKIRDLLAAVSNVRITGFEKDAPASLAPYGLDPALGRIEVWTEEKGSPKAILVGTKKKGTNDIFAKQGDLPYVVTIPEYFKNANLEFKVGDFRDKDVLKFDAGSAQILTLSHAAKTVTFKRDDQGNWTAEGRPGAQGEASDLVTHLGQATVLDFSDTSSLKDPIYIAKVSLGDGTQRTFRFGPKEKDKVSVTAEGGREVYLISSEVYPKLEACFKGGSTPIPLPASFPSK